MNEYSCVKGALTKMVKALVPRQRKEKSVFVTQKFNSKFTVAKKRNLSQNKSFLCTEKYFQTEGVTNDEKITEETE